MDSEDLKITSEAMIPSGDSKKISTSEILEQLKQAKGDNTKFFYLYVSTGGIEQKQQDSSQSQQDQPTCALSYLGLVGDDGADSSDNADSTAIARKSVENNPPVPKKLRLGTMGAVHRSTLPNLLYSDGWKKVYDKDMNITYRALYFNFIEKKPNEDDSSYILRVAKIKEKIYDATKELKKTRGVNFKINCLLSKPFLYD